MSQGSSSSMSFLQLMILLIYCSSCSQSLSPSFQPDTSYIYHYTLNLDIEPTTRMSMPGSSIKVDANVRTSLLWRNKDRTDDQLIQVQIQDFDFHHISSPRKKSATGEDISTQQLTEKNSTMFHPVLFQWTSGKVVGLYVTSEDSGQSLELKKGLVSLFQFQPLSGTFTEDDVTGSCRVTYVTSDDIIKKTKHLRSCSNSPIDLQADPKVLGISWNSTSRSQALLNGSTIQTAFTEESHVVLMRVKSNLGSRIASRQHLELTESIPGPPEIHGPNIEKILEELPIKYQKVEIEGHPLKRSKETDQTQKAISSKIIEAWKVIKRELIEDLPERQRGHSAPHDQLSLILIMIPNYFETSKQKSNKVDVAKASTTRHFHRTVRMLRHAKKSDILQYLRNASAVAAQSPASVSALSEFLDFSKKKQATLNEKFLYSAAFTPHPSEELLNLVLEKLTGKVSKPSLMETGILVLGAIIGKLCIMDLCDLQDVERAKTIIVQGLNNAEDEAEIQIYLLSLKNAQLPETVPLILDYTEDSSPVVCSAALSALQDFPVEYISTMEVRDTLQSIFHQTHQKFDKKCRLLAAETLLATDPSHTDLNNILQHVDSMNNETAALLLSKVHKSLSFTHPLRKPTKKLRDMRYLNYGMFTKSGSSSCFSGLLTASEDMALTYDLDLLFSESGLLKRSVSEIMLFDHNDHIKAMQVSIDTHGLDSIISEGSKEEGEDEASVGMSASLFGVQLLPVVFFKGYMDLMTKVLMSSGETTSVVKGNVLLVDDNKWLPLQSGLQILIQFQAGIGLDIQAKIDVVIWEQQCRTNVNTRAGLVLEFNARLDTPFFTADLTSQVDAETTVSLDSIMAMTSFPMQLCLELSQGDIPHRETYILTESFPEKNITHTTRKGRKATVWAQGFPLSRSNSELCRRMKSEDAH